MLLVLAAPAANHQLHMAHPAFAAAPLDVAYQSCHRQAHSYPLAAAAVAVHWQASKGYPVWAAVAAQLLLHTDQCSAAAAAAAAAVATLLLHRGCPALLQRKPPLGLLPPVQQQCIMSKTRQEKLKANVTNRLRPSQLQNH